MGEIRSALDIALERTADIQSDKSSAERRELGNAGKRAAGEFLSEGDTSVLTKILAGKSAEQKKMVTAGVLSNLLATMHLPADENDTAKIACVGNGVEVLLPGKGMNKLFKQVEQILGQYLGEREHLEQALAQQFMPRLRAKQQELAKRYGQNVPLDLKQDPEYLNALSKNRQMLEQKYGALIDEIRARVREAAGIEE